jgi:hypothetical protein
MKRSPILLIALVLTLVLVVLAASGGASFAPEGWTWNEASPAGPDGWTWDEAQVGLDGWTWDEALSAAD